MFIEAIIISVIIGLIRGGKLRRFNALNRSSFWLLLLGVAIQYLVYFAGKADDIGVLDIIVKHSKEISIIAYILIFVGVISNIRFKSLWAVLTGIVLNVVSLATNGWVIPNLIENPSQNVNFPILGYTIRFYEPYPIPQTLSLGDIIISFGIFALIQEVMLGSQSNKVGFRFK